MRHEHVLADGATERLGSIGSDLAERRVRGEGPKAPWPDGV